jgi:phthiodiolone/phenolphthiodiolone dimycocerosates ketoreductase
MTNSSIKTILPVWSSRYIPPLAMAAQAQALEASGIVDDCIVWDQLVGIYPQELWNKNNRLGEMAPDYDSFPDPYALAGYVAHAAPNLGVTVTGDCIRQGPAERLRAMLTLADLTEGRATFLLGAGEVKQCTPFGWKRSNSLKRMDEHFQIYRKFLETEGPIDFDGDIWKLDHAWLGESKRHTPKFWGMGGGPKLFDLSTSYADGLSTLIPGAWSTPDRTAAGVARLHEQLVNKGRDPQNFDIAAWALILMHEDGSKIDRALDNPLVKWAALIWGRLQMGDWEEEGFEPPMPRDWHYGLDFIPMTASASELEDAISRFSREMVEKSCLIGSPQEIAAQLKPHIDAGITGVIPCDVLQMALEPEDALQGAGRAIELCQHLKGVAPSPA